MGEEENPVKETALVNLKVRGTKYQGSFQVWENRKSKMANQYFDIGKYYGGEPRKEIPDNLFDRMAILDFLTGNMDRHAENWLIIQDDASDKNKVTDLVAVDGGKSMSSTHSDNWLEWHNQYSWKLMKKYANRTFSGEGVKIIDRVHGNKDSLVQDIRAFYEKHEKGPCSKRLTNQRIEKVQERLTALHKFAHEGKTLGKLQRTDQF
ncbi:MAG: hypothetical protein ACI9S8_002606 [Chlamydiales bacterium]|jgi:hypothetical protein